MDNQQRSFLQDQGLKLIEDLGVTNGKRYGLYLCPQCNTTHTYRINDITQHYKHRDYPKLCSKCANINAGKKRIVHNEIATRLYSIWKNLRQRITNPNLPKAHLYYGKPLEPSWNDFTNFKEWALASGYTEELTIDRIDSSLGYTKENCRWITLSENSSRAGLRENNPNVKITTAQVVEILKLYNSGLTQQQIADKYKVGRTTISYILKKERSTTIPNGSTSEANADGSSVQSQD